MPRNKSVYNERYQENVRKALDQVFRQAQRREPLTFNLDTDRFVIFSDHHRGIRNRADDFRHAERAYNSALAYYYRMGYTLVILGDSEELWEELPREVLPAYAHSFELEAHFHHAGRYLRVWGNHDDDWRHPYNVEKRLDPIYAPPPLKVHETLLFNVVDQGRSLGQIFMVHGHQGTTASDRYSRVSKIFVRHVWRTYQRISGVSLNTPANDWVLRERHNIALYDWAQRQEKVVLIAGHTHRPVFESRTHPDQIATTLESLEAQLAAAPNDAPEETALLEQVSLLAAELEWIRAQESDGNSAEGRVTIMKKPCYFNTGCCSFSDGDITGITLADGRIELIHFPDYEQKPRPKVLASDTIEHILSRC